MADYDKRYRLRSAPAATLDGSGCVTHDVWAEAREVGEQDWFTIPGRHKTIAIPAAQLQEALNGPGTVAAYKAALSDNLNTLPAPTRGWNSEQLEGLLDANDEAEEAALDADYFITVTLGLTYPVHFVM